MWTESELTIADGRQGDYRDGRIVGETGGDEQEIRRHEKKGRRLRDYIFKLMGKLKK